MSHTPAHLLQEHAGCSLDCYRRDVLRSSLRQWPEPITPQILRSRLAAFKEEFSDANFALAACACCAREKRQCKLVRVIIPAMADTCAPSWLGYTDEEWAAYHSGGGSSMAADAGDDSAMNGTETTTEGGAAM